MARQIIDIGVQGNDGTGDSIRESFRKVNENFRALYAVFGEGGQIRSTDLDDFPSTYEPQQIFVVNDAGDNVNAVTLIGGAGIGVVIADNNDGTGTLTINSTSVEVASDASPTLGGPLAGGGFPIGKIADPSSAAVSAFNLAHSLAGSAAAQEKDLVMTQGYADRRYYKQSGTGTGGGSVRLRNEPLSAAEYTLTIAVFEASLGQSGLAKVVSHGLTTSSDGTAFTYSSTGTDATGLASGSTYYIKFVDNDHFSLHPSAIDAINYPAPGSNKITVIDGTGSGTQTLLDIGFNEALEGFWHSQEGLPRNSVVRRQGDTMEGTLTLSDHPGLLSGLGTPNDSDDLQAVTKFYVDNSSFTSPTNLYVSTKGDDLHLTAPVGKEGRALAYAYRTVGAACAKAESLIEISQKEPGPYRQKISYTLGNAQYFTTISTGSYEVTSGPNYTNTVTHLRNNKSFIQEEVIAYLNYNITNELTINVSGYGDVNFTNFQYNSDLCKRDVGLFIEAICIDLLTAGNYQSVQAGKSYYRNVSSLVAINRQLGQTLAGIQYASQLAQLALDDLEPATLYQAVVPYDNFGSVPAEFNTTDDLVLARFNTIIDIATNGVESAPVENFGTGLYRFRFSNGGNTAVDQGVITNTDIIAGKIVRGFTSGATGRIFRYERNAVAGTDRITLQLLKPVDFIEGEEIEYAASVSDLNITIFIESGTYEEDFPIRLPTNCSIKGDEFRRSIIRPKNRRSQSIWTNTYFFRDKVFDNLRLTNLTGPSVAPSVRIFPGNLPITAGSFVFGQTYIIASLGDTVWTSIGATPGYTVGTQFSATGAGTGTGTAFIPSAVSGDITVNMETGTASSSWVGQIWSGNGGEGVITATSVSSFTVRLHDNLISRAAIVGGSWEIRPTTEYGYHYLENPSIPKNVGSSYSSIGGYDTQAKIISSNKANIQTAVVNYINALPGPNLNATEEAKSRRDTAYIVDALVLDLQNSGNENILEIQGTFYGVNLTTECKQGIAYIATYINTTLISSSSNVIKTTVTNLISSVVFAFNAGFNPPKNNRNMDVFLCNDAVIVRNITCQEHGGFMMVLDPNGQILTKSPYGQVGTSFSGSTNRKRFAGGQFIDGYSGNLRVTITNVATISGATVLALSGTDLQKKDRINAPTAFYIADNRFQIDSVSSFTKVSGTANVILNSGTPWPVNDPATGLPWVYPRTGVVLETAGNRSMLANDFTQVNDLGYGIVATNNGVTEQVSTFTYYNWTSYYAVNGAQIRSTNGSSCNGQYGLRAIGGDPSEIPDVVELVYRTVQPARVYLTTQSPYTAGVLEDVSFYVYDYTYTPFNTSEVEIKHTTAGYGRYEITNAEKTNVIAGRPATELVGTKTYRIQFIGTTNFGSIGASLVTAGSFVTGTDYIINFVGDTAWTSIGAVQSTIGTVFTATGSGGATTGTAYAVNFTASGAGTGSGKAVPTATITNISKAAIAVVTTSSAHGFQNGQSLRITNVTGMTQINNPTGNVKYIKATGYAANQFAIYDNQQLVTPINTSGAGYTVYSGGGIAQGGSELVKLNLSTAGTSGTSTSGLQEGLVDGDIISVRQLQQFQVKNLDIIPATRPSTAVVFADQTYTTYRTIAFGTQAPSGFGSIPTNNALISFDTSLTYVLPICNRAKLSDADPVDGGPKTMGANPGDTRIAVFTTSDTNQLAGLNSNKLVFVHEGKVHRIVSYTEAVGSVSAYITIDDVGVNISPTPVATGLQLGFPVVDIDFTIRAGLPEDSSASVTIRISTCRATGHDFLDIGTGGFNATNFPSNVFGDPANEPNDENEVVEETTGRVFYVSTNQDGVFKVGRFFKVDQGTGDVSFNAGIALTNLAGIGFKRGVTVNEFSTDDTMTDVASDTVPTESAVVGYVNRRLGLTQLDAVEPNPIGPGYMPRNGTLSATANMNLGGNQINSVQAPTEQDDAANKGYVDIQVEGVNSLYKLFDVEIDTPNAGDILFYTGSADSTIDGWRNITLTGDVELQLDSTFGTASAVITPEAITNTEVDRNAAIGHYKINHVTSQIANSIGVLSTPITSIVPGYSGATPFVGRATVTYGALASAPFNAGDIIKIVSASPTTYNQNWTVVSSSTTQTVITCSNTDTYITGGTISVERGVSVFDTDNFEVSDNGFIKIKSGGVAFSELANMGTNAVLGNLGVSSNTPQELTPQSVYKRGVWNEFNSSATLSQEYALSFTKGGSPTSTEALSSFSIRTVTTDGANNALVKTTAAGKIDAKGYILNGNNVISFNPTNVTTTYITTAGGVNILEMEGSDPLATDVLVLGQWTLGTGATLEATFADLGEYYSSDKTYPVGTVLVFGGSSEVTTTTNQGDTRVAGVVSASAGFIMNTDLGGTKALVALQGRVPCKVIGKVEKGDMLMTSSIAGYAVKAVNPQVGTIIGKAIKNKNDDGEGIVEVAVGRL